MFDGFCCKPLFGFIVKLYQCAIFQNRNTRNRVGGQTVFHIALNIEFPHKTMQVSPFQAEKAGSFTDITVRAAQNMPEKCGTCLS